MPGGNRVTWRGRTGTIIATRDDHTGRLVVVDADDGEFVIFHSNRPDALDPAELEEVTE